MNFDNRVNRKGESSVRTKIMSHLKIAPLNRIVLSPAVAAPPPTTPTTTIIHLVKSRDKKVKDYSRSASIRESISGDSSIKGARGRSNGKKESKRVCCVAQDRPLSGGPRCHASARAEYLPRDLRGFVAQNGINYPRISALLRFPPSLFVFLPLTR